MLLTLWDCNRSGWAASDGQHLCGLSSFMPLFSFCLCPHTSVAPPPFPVQPELKRRIQEWVAVTIAAKKAERAKAAA